MTTSSAALQTRLSRAQWIVLILLVISVFSNYIDRSNLSVAAPLIEKEVSLNPEQLGRLFSAFFWTYALFQLFGVAGWLVERFNVYLVLGLGFLIWNAATAVTGLVSGFATLFVLRLLVGMGESIAYPSYSKIFASDFAEHHRGLANALIDAGSKLGPALSTLLGGLIVARFGWRAFFIALGLVSLIWLLPWFRLMPHDRHTASSARVEGGPGIGEILRLRDAWGTFADLFCVNYFWYFLLTWLPKYLVSGRNFPMETMATVGSLAYFVIAASTTTTGWLADRFIARGATPTRVRKTCVATGLAGSTIILPVAVVSDVRLAMMLLMLSCLFFGIFTSSHWAITQTLAGPKAAGKWTSLQNGIGNLAGVVSPWLTGFIVHETGSYVLAFAAAAGVALTGAAVFLFVIGPIQPVAWKTTEPLPGSPKL